MEQIQLVINMQRRFVARTFGTGWKNEARNFLPRNGPKGSHHLHRLGWFILSISYTYWRRTHISSRGQVGRGRHSVSFNLQIRGWQKTQAHTNPYDYCEGVSFLFPITAIQLSWTLHFHRQHSASDAEANRPHTFKLEVRALGSVPCVYACSANLAYKDFAIQILHGGHMRTNIVFGSDCGTPERLHRLQRRNSANRAAVDWQVRCMPF